VLSYLHAANNCSITRSSQPLTGWKNDRSTQDEKLVAGIFSSSQPRKNGSTSPDPNSSTASIAGDITGGNSDVADAEISTGAKNLQDSIDKAHAPIVYGAQQTNVIFDARPRINALAMQAIGRGAENMDNYKFASQIFMGIANIHVMRNSLQKVIDAIKDSDLTPLPPSRELLAKSDWLKHISLILDGADKIAETIAIHHAHVLIHCSDGWDRTSQLSALSQICLDPYYRTMEGFIVLVEKDWLSFGHMFRHRSGYLGSEKWFVVQNDGMRGSGNDSGTNAFTNASGNALESALLNAKGFFSKNNASRDSVAEGDPADADQDDTFTAKESDKGVTKVSETSPVFHQFLDATYQLLYQNPTRFEFNERFLRRLLYHLYSCQYGTFLYDSEKDRVDAKVTERTRSVWDYFLSRKKEFTNDKYDGGVIDDNKRGAERLIRPRVAAVRWWSEVFGRSDEEMNAPPEKITPRKTNNRREIHAEGDRIDGHVATGLGSRAARGDSIQNSSGPFSAGGSLNAGLSGLSLGGARSSSSATKKGASGELNKETEVEMK
jgi:myotubularin-related protein 6/7/8